MAQAYHLLLVPDEVTPDDVEALAVSVWNEAGWLAPGILQLQESVTLEGPWSLDEDTAAALGSPSDNEQVWLLRCPARRGAPPSSAVMAFDEPALAVLLHDAVPEFSPLMSTGKKGKPVIVPFPGRRGRRS